MPHTQHMKLIKKTAFIFLILCNTLSSKAQLTQIPFELKGAHLYIKVQAKSNDMLNFIFDTGATGASIDSTVAERIGISKENLQTVTIDGNGGSQSYQMASHQQLKIGNVKIEDLNLVRADFKSLSANLGHQLDGIVGYDVLNHYVTKLDFDQKKISLYEQISHADTTGYTGIPFEFSKNILIPRFPVSITLANGETFTGRVMFDTGSIFSLIVSNGFNKFHDFKSKIGPVTLTHGRGVSAITNDQIAMIKSMSVQGFDFGPMTIRLTVSETGKAYDGYLGIMGIEIIKRFNVILDYANLKIYLKPNKAYYEPLTMEGVFK